MTEFSTSGVEHADSMYSTEVNVVFLYISNMIKTKMYIILNSLYFLNIFLFKFGFLFVFLGNSYYLKPCYCLTV